FVADLRARPHKDKEHEGESTKEQPHRLTEQFCRLSMCEAVAMGKSKIDADVQRICRRMALDMARGWPLDFCRIIVAEGNTVSAHKVAGKMTRTEDWAY